MKNVLITGGTGLIGKRLTVMLIERGYNVSVLSRKKNSKPQPGQPVSFYWDPSKREIETEALSSATYLIHLAGENIGKKRWTKKRKEELVKSRVDSTRFLCDQLNQSHHTIETVISASAIGFYGLEPEGVCTENSPVGIDFLATLTRDWEKETDLFRSAVKQVSILRTGIVLSRDGGLLPQLIKSFVLRLAFLPGKKNPYLSWIHIDDLCQLIVHLMEDKASAGVYNAVAPQPVTLREFLKEAACVLSKKIVFIAVPVCLLKFLLGERASLLTASARISSQKIQETGFSFQWKTIQSALNNLFSKK